MPQWTSIDELRKGENWLKRAREMAALLGESLVTRGTPAKYAPELPPLKDGLRGGIEQPYRYLSMWIPDWAPDPFAGKTVVRVDTISD